MAHLFRRSIHLTIAVLALLIVFISIVARIVVWQRMERSVEETMQAADIESKLDTAFSLMQDAETGQRGFLLTGLAPYLEPYERAVRELPVHFAQLEEMLTVRKDAGYVFSECKAASVEQLAGLAQTLQLYQAQGLPAVMKVMAAGAGKVTMDKIRGLISRIKELMTADFARADAGRLADARSAVRWTTASGLSGVIAGLVALFMYAQAQRQSVEKGLQEMRANVAEEVTKHKSAFLANMSHEIRTPLNAVLGFTELMESESLTERQQSYVHSIQQSGQSLLQLINDILDLCKVEAGMIELHPAPTDLREIGEFVRTVIGQTCVKKGVDLRINIPRSIPRALLLDEARLRQILVNLAGNAARFTETGFVALTAEVQYHPEDRALTLTLTVEDTGCGIPADQQKAIFDAFVQAGPGHSTAAQGTGLGLSIVKRLTELMHGTVRVQSELGRGSTFIVVLPDVAISAQSKPAAPGGEDTRVQLDDFLPADILVVDDNPVNRDLLAGIFADTQHQVRFAANGQEALQAMKQEKPDLVLMDVRMPVMTGTEAVDHMRRTPNLKAIPVIAVTASSLHQEEGAVRESFDGYLRKPFSRAELFRELAHFLLRRPPDSIPPLAGLVPDMPGTEARAAAWRLALRKLRQMEMSTWAALQNTQATTEVKDFAWRLQLLAETADCPPLRNYADTLRTHATNFSADELEKHLAAFPALLTMLEELSAPA